MDLKNFSNSLYRRLKHIIKSLYRVHAIVDSKQKKHVILDKKQNNGGKIKVGFIVQVPEIWDKEAPLYEAMLRDERFDAYLIIVPHYNIVMSKLEQYGAEKIFFTEKYSDSKVVLMDNENDMVVDDSYDYVFYQRCWEGYLPKQLRCKNVINYALTCYIPYCYHCGADPKSYYRNNFFWYLSKFYCCSEFQYKNVKGIQGVECQFLGYPAFDCLHYNDESHRGVNVLWTPRWTDDPMTGGTSFNRYREKILEIKHLHKDINLILRPHPLTFENAIKVGWMTESEVDDYKIRVSEMGVKFDRNKLIEDTFLHTDILITDFSSAIIVFFMSGRPIICCSNINFEMDDTFKEVVGSLYFARDWNELCRIVNELVSGCDILHEQRQEVIKKIKNDRSAVERIMNDLVSSI